MKVYASKDGRELYTDASKNTVEVSCGETVTIEKMFGPLVFWDIRVTADFAACEWVVEREFGPDGTWKEVARIPGQLDADFASA